MPKQRPIECPYLLYARMDRKSIKCRTSVEGLCVKLHFDNSSDCQKWLERFCNTEYDYCPYFNFNHSISK